MINKFPFIAKKTFDEKEYSVSEYTMSEILASVYDYIEETGKKEGILFLYTFLFCFNEKRWKNQTLFNKK